MISQFVSLRLSSFYLTFVGWFISLLCWILRSILLSYFFIVFLYFRSNFNLFFHIHVYFAASIFFRFFNTWKVCNTIVVVVIVTIIFFLSSAIFLLGWLFLLIWLKNNCSCIFKSNCSFSIWKWSILFSIFRLWWRILLLADFFDHLRLDIRMSC